MLKPPRFLQRIVVLAVTARLLLPLPAQGFSIGEERMLGEKLLYAVRSEFELLDDPDISQYINGIGREVLEAAGPQYFDYHFFVVKNDQFNAFAAPSGLIFFNTGLVKVMKNEDQLVSVMAHEIGHVASRHIASRMAKQTKVSALSMLFALASLAAGNPALTQGLFTGSLAAGSAASLSFSRDDEEQADRVGFDLMRKMGRDPDQMAEMLKVMRRVARYSSEQMPPYLLTHPNPEDRLHYVQSLLERHGSNVAGSQKHTKADFAFLRFKYRVLAQTLEPDAMRAACAAVASADKSPLETGMARYGLALLSAKEMDFSNAVRLMQQARQDCPGHDILDTDLAVLQIEAGQMEQAMSLLRRAHQRNPADLYAAFHLARALERSGDLAGAERLQLENAKAMPDYPQVYYELGRLKSRQNQPGNSNFYLAKHYLYKGRIKYAKQYLERAGKDQSVPAALREEAKSIVERLKKLEESS